MIFRLLLFFFLVSCAREQEVEAPGQVRFKVLKLPLTTSLNTSFKTDNLPDSLKLGDNNYQFEYFIDFQLEKKIKALLKKWKPRYGAVTVIDNKTGGILAGIDYSRQTDSFSRKLSFSTTHPAASIIKIITASSLIERGRISRRTPFYFNGRSTTLYKDQLKDTKNKWTRETSFGKAFSFSNNVVFAKAILKYGDKKSLRQMAKKFGFEKNITDFITLPPSRLFTPKNSFELAELATGFNKRTLTSPLHSAVIASVIPNQGFFKNPKLVKSIKKDGKKIWEAKFSEKKKVISKSTVSQLENMMIRVVKSGTARKMFQKYPTPILKKLIIGGKTGSITGGKPYGKRDWFVSYAKPKAGGSAGISVAVMLILGKDWKVRSTLIGKKVYEFYFGK